MELLESLLQHVDAASHSISFLPRGNDPTMDVPTSHHSGKYLPHEAF